MAFFLRWLPVAAIIEWVTWKLIFRWIFRWMHVVILYCVDFLWYEHLEKKVNEAGVGRGKK